MKGFVAGMLVGCLVLPAGRVFAKATEEPWGGGVLIGMVNPIYSSALSPADLVLI